MLNKKIIVSIIGLCVMALVISCGGDTPKKKKTSSKVETTETEKKISSTKEQEITKAKPAPPAKLIKSSSKTRLEQQGTPPAQIKKAKELIEAATEEKLAALKPKKLFKNYCGICHGYKGNMEINGAKDLTKSNLSLEEAVAQVYHGKGLMTPFKGIMKDDEIVAVSKYIEELRR